MGSGSGVHGSRPVGGARGLGAEVEEDRRRGRRPAMPSIIAWWLLDSSAKPPSARPSTSHSSHSGLERSSCWEKTRAERLQSCSSLPGRGQRGVADVVLEVEVRVVDPQRPAGRRRAGRRAAGGSAARGAGARGSSRGSRRRPGAGPPGAHERADVHVRDGSLLVQEGGVDRGQPVEVALGHRRQLVRTPRTLSAAMAWDFSTEPEFQAQLDWMARVRARGDLAAGDARPRPGAARPRARAAAGAGPRARAVGCAPAARARRTGLRPGQARPHARDPRHVAVRAERLRQPGAGLGQQRAARARRHARAEGALARAAARRRPALGVLDDRARRRRRRPDDARDDRRARRGAGEWVIDGHKWFTLQRLGRRLPHRHGRDRARGARRTSARR